MSQKKGVGTSVVTGGGVACGSALSPGVCAIKEGRMEGGPGEIRLSEGEVTPAGPCSGVAEGAEGIDVLVWGSGHGRGAQACRRRGEGYRDGAFA